MDPASIAAGLAIANGLMELTQLAIAQVESYRNSESVSIAGQSEQWARFDNLKARLAAGPPTGPQWEVRPPAPPLAALKDSGPIPPLPPAA